MREVMEVLAVATRDGSKIKVRELATNPGVFEVEISNDMVFKRYAVVV